MKTIKLFAGVIAMTLAFAACGGVDSKIADLKAACEAGEGEKATEIAIELAELVAEDEKAISEEQDKEVQKIMQDCDCLDFEKLMKAAKEIAEKK